MTTATKRPNATEKLVCWKVWGGNDSASIDISIPGLSGVLHASPHEAENGGDVYYMSACGSGAIARLCLADVSGHGEEVAEIASWLGQIFSRNIHRENPDSVLQAVNARVSARGYEAMSTAVCVSYNSLTGTMYFGNAGHPHIRIFRKGGSGWEDLQPPSPTGDGLWNVPLGVSGDARYALGKETFHPGDRIIFYTDGLMEARDGEGNLIGDKVWDGLSPEMSPAAQFETILSTYRKHIGSPDDTQDDLTLILLEVQPLQRGNRFSLFARNHGARLWRRFRGQGGE